MKCMYEGVSVHIKGNTLPDCSGDLTTAMKAKTSSFIFLRV